MGREIKRVEANFDWPLGERWAGSVAPPDGKDECPDCKLDGDSCGYNDVGRAFYALGTRRGEHFNYKKHFASEWATRHRGTVEIFEEKGLLRDLGYHEANPILPQDVKDTSPTQRAFLELLAKKSAETRKWERNYTMGSMIDSRYALYDTMCILAEALGSTMEEAFYCRTCKGDATVVVDEEQNRLYENYNADDPDPSVGPTPNGPPPGEWWQVWETVSEGSPVTPAFATAEELINYLSENGDLWCQRRMADEAVRGTFGLPPTTKPSRESATRFVLGSGFVPSMVIQDGVIKTDIHAAEDF